MMKNYRIIIVLAFLSIMFFISGQKLCFAQKDGEDIVIGKYRMIHSQVLDEDRLLLIHLPREYGDTQLSYPVLYLLYGQDINNYFAEAVIITEKLGSTGEIPPVVIIGVANTNRYRDNLPAKIRGRSESGGADNFLRFFEEELIPYVDKNYRTKKFRMLAGPQAGAVFGLYALITKPKLFHAVLSENPFMNPENSEFLYPRAELFFKNAESLKSFLYIKCEKNERPQDLEYAERLAKLLDSEQPDGLRYKVEFREPSGYFIAPLPFREGLRELFAGHKLPENFQINTVQDIIHYYEKLSDGCGFEVDPPSLMMTFEGDKLSQQGKTKEAIELFEYQLSLYPKSLNALWRLGETYRGMGDLEKARQYYRTFLDIRDVDAAMIRHRLNQVERMISGSAAYRIDQEIRKKGIQAGLKKFKEIRSDPRNELYFEESEFNAMGYRLMGAGKMREAIEIFRLNVAMYPESANVYDSLAEACLHWGDKYNTIQYYKKSLELNPQNENARSRLERMDELFEEYHPTTPEDALFAAGEKTGLNGPYLGQKPPGVEKEIFAQGIVSTNGGHEFSCTFSSDGKEFYFNRGMTIMICRWEKEGWTAPEPASFNGDFRNHEPHITADNQTLYFGSMRPNPERPEMENPYGIWKVERTEKGWGEPSYVGYGMYVTTTKDGTIYITDIDYEDGKKHGIARTELVNGRFGSFEKQRGGVISPAPGRMSGRHPCIALDESFLIFDSYTIDPPGEHAQLFICFRESDGLWGKAINLSRLLGTEGNIAASLSPDGKYMFFEAESDIYWISTKIFDRLKK